MTLRASRTDVLGGELSEARLPTRVMSGIGRSEPPMIRWGMGGAAADDPELQQFGEPAQERYAGFWCAYAIQKIHGFSSTVVPFSRT
jgi:hypothetical protein